tara:strand:+ start:814 stop:1407 length:594 start_codon:yes stop_codon:yes gene_type:complete
MAKKRKVYAPFSLTSEAGVGQTPVEGYIDVDQQIYPTVATGTVNENGKWVGVKSSDDEFFAITKHVAVANGGNTLSPDTGTINSFSMEGFRDLFIAIKPDQGGNFRTQLVMGPDTGRYANLEPVNAAQVLRYKSNPDAQQNQDYVDVFNDAAESLTADVWNIFQIQDRCRNWKHVNILLTNNTGSECTFEVGIMRIV